MEGYLQALIDIYQKLYLGSLGDRKEIYRSIVDDLRCMQHYSNSKELTKDEGMKPLEAAEKKKRIAMIFTGKSTDLTKFLNDNSKGAD